MFLITHTNEPKLFKVFSTVKRSKTDKNLIYYSSGSGSYTCNSSTTFGKKGPSGSVCSLCAVVLTACNVVSRSRAASKTDPYVESLL